MPPIPHAPRNERGSSADFWDGYMQAHWARVEANALMNDGMTVSRGGGEAAKPPRGLRFMEDAQAAGDLVLAGERIAA